MLYSYEAKDGAGRTVTGSLDARDERMAATLVRDQGYFPTRVVPLSGNAPQAAGPSDAPYVARRTQSASPWRWALIHLIYPITNSVSLDELAMSYRQFGAMLQAGVPIYQCLTTLVQQTRNLNFRRALQTIGDRVHAGGSLSDAMGEFPWIFTDFHCAMVVAGETTGRLDLMFFRLAEALEQEQAMRRSIRRETLYPKIVIVCAFLLPPIYLLFLGHPKAYVTAAIVPLIIAVVAYQLFFVLLKIVSQARQAYHTYLAHLPGIGGTVRMIALARFCRSLATLYAAGVALPKSLRSSAETCGNAFIGARIVRAIPSVEAGHGIVESLRGTNVFPPMVMSMLDTGEQTGSLDHTMNHVADFYEQESIVRLHQTSTIIGVIAYLIAAIIVARDVIGFWSSYAGSFNGLLSPDAG